VGEGEREEGRKGGREGGERGREGGRGGGGGERETWEATHHILKVPSCDADRRFLSRNLALITGACAGFRRG
jgi:hypothetical protein